MRWIPFIAFFLYVYIEISIFIQVAHVLGVLLTLILVIFTSVIGMSLVRNQGFKNFLLMQQKMAAGESPAAEMIKSVSLIIAGLLLILPGFQCLLQRTLHKMNWLTERNLRQMVAIRFDNAGNTRISSRGLRIVHQHNRLAVMRHLHHTRQQTVR